MSRRAWRTFWAARRKKCSTEAGCVVSSAWSSLSHVSWTCDLDRLLLDDEVARLDFREVENLVDQIHHALGLSLRFEQQVRVHGIELVPFL